ncbi:hypothetical protein JIR23_29850 [Bradyrhizobium diazoefficiens]|nr:hypothetical protein [Bradyrhizobium diazoefficiens]QQN63666.1 hypothetical protein JIR23_29850 [Bradyrhizobium diazoefficiens]
MKADDPRLEQAHKDLLERNRKYEEQIVGVLKGHLAAEQALNDLLRAARRKWKRPFAGKIDVAQKLFLPDLTTEMWDVIKAGNDLRNAVAHGHKTGTITQRIANLRRAMLTWASPGQRPGIEQMTEPQLISTAFYQCASFIVVATLKLQGKY